MTPVAVTRLQSLAPAQEAAVAALIAVARERDGVAAPLHPAAPPSDARPDDINYFLAYRDGELVGVFNLVGYQETEGSGLVHPDHRRGGIGRVLLAAANAEVARRGFTSWLLVCEATLPSGPLFAIAVGGKREFADYRLLLDPARLPAPAPTSALTCRRATLDDASDLAAIVAAAFGDPLTEVRGWVRSDFDHADRYWYIATIGLAPVGTLRVRLIEGEGTYITGFSIAPAYQNQRLGRQFLLTVLAQLRAEGHPTILIEVETNNAPANALYRAAGFQPLRTFEYYRVGV